MTPIDWLQVMSCIPPPHLRREQLTQKKFKRILNTVDLAPVRTVIEQALTTERFNSRRPFYKYYNPAFNLKAAWQSEANGTPRGGELVSDLCQPLPGFNTAPRKQWTCANRLRSGHGMTAANLYR